MTYRILLLIFLATRAFASDTPPSDWWSLQPTKTSPPPEIKGTKGGWLRNPIDAFILARLTDNGLSPSKPANPRTLIRRLYYDLVGLPPSPDQITVFLADPSEEAYVTLVDELLSSPHYGERWARHWLDVVRYGESNGFEYNEPRRNAWPYRDWVIQAFNADLPYDQFAYMQLAGDVIQPGWEGGSAVGFLVAGIHNPVMGSSDTMKRQLRQEELEEIIGAIGQTFLGLTVNCARCHDHKVDPIPTTDYYRLIALVSGIKHGEHEYAPDPGKPNIKIHTAVSHKPGAVRVHNRGSVTDLGDEVVPGVLTSIPSLNTDRKLDASASDAKRRQHLAQWITDPSNPLFTRVIVNRIWQYHFGVGLVKTPSDFGRNGGVPSHPALLDWLASWFQQNHYRFKALHKLIVTSATYRQSAVSQPAGHARDADNRLLWRFAPRRIEGEVLRDAMLLVSGQLNPHMGGPGFEDVREEHYNAGRYYHPTDPEGVAFNRRTVYRFAPRGGRSAVLDTFDCPDPSTATPTRAVTTTPLQALSLRNNPFVWRMSKHFAERVRAAAGEDPLAQAAQACQLALGRSLDPAERERVVALIKEHGLPAVCRAFFNCGEFVVIE